MPELIDKKVGFWIKRKIRCPGHFLLKTGCRPFKMEINPRLKQLPKWAFEKFKIPYERPARDKHGQPIRNHESFYQPLVGAAWAIEHIYDPESVICKTCRGRCLEGLGKINTNAIRRLRRHK